MMTAIILNSAVSWGVLASDREIEIEDQSQSYRHSMDDSNNEIQAPPKTPSDLECGTRPPPPKNWFNRCCTLFDTCSIGAWIILDPVFGYGSIISNGLGSLAAFIATQLDKDNADYAHYASAGLTVAGTILGTLKVIAANHKEAHIKKMLDRLPLEAQRQRGVLNHLSQNNTAPPPPDDDANTPSKVSVSWNDLPAVYRYFQHCLGCYHACSFVTWTLLEGPLGFGAVVLSTAGSILSGATPQTKGNVHEIIQWTAFIADGAATLCSALKHYAVIRQETEAYRLKKTFGKPNTPPVVAAGDEL